MNIYASRFVTLAVVQNNLKMHYVKDNHIVLEVTSEQIMYD